MPALKYRFIQQTFVTTWNQCEAPTLNIEILYLITQACYIFSVNAVKNPNERQVAFLDESFCFTVLFHAIYIFHYYLTVNQIKPPSPQKNPIQMLLKC